MKLAVGMKATLFRCILVALWRHGCYPEDLDSLSIMVSAKKIEFCQSCLLTHAGAIHVDVIEVSKKRGSYVTYWVVGSSTFVAFDVIRCDGYHMCRNLKITKSNARFNTEGIGGILTTNKLTGNDRSPMQTLPVADVGTSEQHRAGLPVGTENTNSEGIEQQTEQRCLYRIVTTATAPCDICLQTKSGSGTLKNIGW